MFPRAIGILKPKNLKDAICTKPSIILSTVFPNIPVLLLPSINPSFHQPVKYSTAFLLSKFLLKAVTESIRTATLAIPANPPSCTSASPCINRDPLTNSNSEVLRSYDAFSILTPLLLSYSFIISTSISFIPLTFLLAILFRAAPLFTNASYSISDNKISVPSSCLPLSFNALAFLLSLSSSVSSIAPLILLVLPL